MFQFWLVININIYLNNLQFRLTNFQKYFDNTVEFNNLIFSHTQTM